MGTQQVVNEYLDQQLEQFWVNFRLFPTKWERLIFENFIPWAGVSIFPYILLLSVVTIWIIFFDLDQEIAKRKILDPQIIIVVVDLLLISPPYLYWQTKIPKIFKWLLSAGKFLEGDGELKKKYLEYLTEYQKLLLVSPRRYSFSVLFCLVVLVYNLRDLDALNISIATQALDAVLALTKRVFGLLFWGYFAGLAVWPVFVTGNQIYKLSKKFEINVKARHPDRCGGLKPLGDFCFSMTLPIVVGGIVLVLFGIGGLFNNVSLQGALITEIGENAILSANLLLLFVFLPLTVIAFFLPLWNVHQEMVDQKMKYEEEFTAEILRLEDQIRISLREENGLEKARIAKDKIEIFQTLNPNTIGFPVWPFRFNRLLTLFSPQLLGGISTVVSIFQAIFRNP